MYLADTLSRAASVKPEEQMSHTELIFCAKLKDMYIAHELSVYEPIMSNLQKATKADEDMKLLMKIILEAWPEDKKALSENMQAFFPFWDELSVQNGVIFQGRQKVHASHAGIQGCIRWGSEVAYWPEMNSDIESFVKDCQTCQEFSDSQQKEPLISSQIPELPWQHLATDLFECKQKS